MLGWLPVKTRRNVEDAVAAVQRALGDELVSALLVGAAVSPSRGDRAREPQVLVIARALPAERLSSLASHAHAAMRAGVRIRALTERELERSCDVFALEIAEWRDRHVLLAGRDPFAACTVRERDLVRALEAAARGLVRRLRNRVLAALGTDGRRDDAGLALADALERSLVIAHHFLALRAAPPAEEKALVTALSEASGVSPDVPLAMLSELRERGSIREPVARAGAFLPWLEKVVERLDALEHAPS